MRTFKTIPAPYTPNEFVDYTPPEVDMSLELVNRSYFVPNREANKILARQNAAQLLDQLSYDSEEDIRNGSVNVFARRKGRDLAEIQQQNLALVKESQEVLRKAKATVMRQAEAQAQAQAQTQAVSQPAQE